MTRDKPPGHDGLSIDYLKYAGLPYTSSSCNQVNNFRWAGALPHPCKLQCSVRQGWFRSPTLFNLYVNELQDEPSNTRVGYYIDGICSNNISYTDDIVLLNVLVCGLRS
ncbi:unnamed protein product [Euphydryas editha]|uniref:Reverse transcriptase domain-containing protein n=1 Tax=Euphydryas editha TaxID=104508 RepID=A0AAU9UZN5_EUPED|nr:unnamed protein product [Euphydryas editha]